MILQWTFEAINKPCNHAVGWPRGQVDSGCGGHHYTDYATSADAALSPRVARPRPRPRPRRRPRTWLPESETLHTVRPNTLEPWRIRRPVHRQTQAGRCRLTTCYCFGCFIYESPTGHLTTGTDNFLIFLFIILLTYILSLTNLQNEFRHEIIVTILEF